LCSEYPMHLCTLQLKVLSTECHGHVFAGEVSAGILTLSGTPYLVVVGEHPKNAPENGVTLMYNINQKTWHVGSKRPYIGNHHAAEVIGNKLYLFGGLKAGAGAIQVGTLTTTAGNVDIAWKSATMPIVSGSAATAQIGGKV
jgi:hypothetical protein